MDEPCPECGAVGFHKMSCDYRASRASLRWPKEDHMSYARFGYDSDIYVYQSASETDDWVCCGCHLSTPTLASQHFSTRQDLLLHLHDHIAAGHKVPPYTTKRLQDEIRTG